MTQTLTANTARANLSTALVAGLSQPFAIKPFPRIAAGETFDVELYLIENGAYDTRSGATGYTPRIRLRSTIRRPGWHVYDQRRR